MNIELLTNELKKELKDNLVSVVVHGSSVTADRTQFFSNENVLVVTKTLDQSVLKQVIPVTHQWLKGNNKPPYFMTETAILSSADVFPLEWTDMKSAHKVLYGKDILAGLRIQLTHLKHQLEFELRSKILQLRQSYIGLAGKPAAVTDLMAKSLSSFSALMKGVLMLKGQNVPAQKKEVWSALGNLIPFDQLVWQKIWGLRDGIPLEKNDDVDQLFAKYLASIETVLEFVDKENV